jgi:hypothetical protein
MPSIGGAENAACFSYPQPDPEDDSELDLRELDELRSEDPVDASRIVLTPAGPIFSENFVRRHFPVVQVRGNPNYLDVAGFTLGLHDALSPNVNGYAMRTARTARRSLRCSGTGRAIPTSLMYPPRRGTRTAACTS